MLILDTEATASLFTFFLAGVGRGQDVRSITQGRIVAAQLGFQLTPVFLHFHSSQD